MDSRFRRRTLRRVASPQVPEGVLDLLQRGAQVVRILECLGSQIPMPINWSMKRSST